MQQPGTVYGHDGVLSYGGEIATSRVYGYGTYEFRLRASSTAADPAAEGSGLSGSVSGAFNYVNNSQTEIDFEALGNEPDTIHLTSWHNLTPEKEPEQNSATETTTATAVPATAQNFYTYSFRWEPGKVSYYVCGPAKLVCDETDLRKPPFTTTVPSDPAYIIINHWGTVNPSWGGTPTIPAYYQTRYLYVDWIRYTPLSN
jgi:beta-glucanase (GH16 family)